MILNAVTVIKNILNLQHQNKMRSKKNDILQKKKQKKTIENIQFEK